MEELKDHYHYIITSKMDDIFAKRIILIENCQKLDIKLQFHALKDIHELPPLIVWGEINREINRKHWVIL
jgi:hypothetical protein